MQKILKSAFDFTKYHSQHQISFIVIFVLTLVAFHMLIYFDVCFFQNSKYYKTNPLYMGILHIPLITLAFLYWIRKSLQLFFITSGILFYSFPFFHILLINVFYSDIKQILIFIYFYYLYYHEFKIRLGNCSLRTIYMVCHFLAFLLFSNGLHLIEIIFLTFFICNCVQFSDQNPMKKCIKMKERLYSLYKTFKDLLMNIPDPTIISKSINEMIISKEASALILSFKCTSFSEFAQKAKQVNGNSLFDILNSSQKEDFTNKVLTINKKDLNGDQIFLCSIKSVPGPPPLKIITLKNISEYSEEREKQLQHKFQNLILFSGSHEMRTQLNIINESFNQLKKNYSPELVQKGSMASKIFERKMNLVFDYIHISNNQFYTTNIPFYPKQILRKIFNLLQVHAKPSVQIIYEYSSHIPFVLKADFNKIISMLSQIALNATKFTYKGNIKLELNYNINRKMLIFEIRDTGIGFDIEDTSVAVIKTPYIHGRNISQRNNRRQSIQPHRTFRVPLNYLSGIGLTSIKMICNRLKGNFSIQTCPNKGTTVTIEVPADPVNYDINNSKIEDESCVTRVFNNSNELELIGQYNILKHLNNNGPSDLIKRANEFSKIKGNFSPINREKNFILVVDDLKFNRDVLKPIIKKECSFPILEADNGLTAIKEVQSINQNFGKLLILMDIDMPIMDGCESSIHIKNLDSNLHIFIIAVTAFENEEIRNKCKASNIDEFHCKPISAKVIKEIIHNFFNISI